jgi:hypothetical protein
LSERFVLFKIGRANLTATIAEPCPLLSGVERYCAFLQKDLLTGEQEVTPTAAFLFMNSYMLYQSSIATALTGHAAAIYPLLRTALESACYGYVMRKDTAIEGLWLNRHDSEAATKAAGKAFTPAVNDAADGIGKANSHPGTAAIPAGHRLGSASEPAIDPETYTGAERYRHPYHVLLLIHWG